MKKLQIEQWVFDCPLHGVESQIFCFRAFNEDNVDRWTLVRGVLEEVNTTREMKRTQMELVEGKS